MASPNTFISFFLILLLSSFTFAGDVCSSKSPLFIDLQSSYQSANTTPKYGLTMMIGNPAQKITLFPSLRSNDTIIAAPAFCTRSGLFISTSDCQAKVGGLFDFNKSSSWAESSTSGDFVQGLDDVQFYTPSSQQSVGSMFQTTLNVQTAGQTTPLLGLGAGSSILDLGDDSENSASRTFSLFVGTGLDRVGGDVNGSLVLDGYDSSQFVGKPSVWGFNYSSSDIMSLRVSNIVIEKTDNSSSNISLFDLSVFPTTSDNVSTGYQSKITTDQFPISLPPSILANLRSQVPMEESGEADGSLKFSDDTTITMTVILSDGFSVTIPADVMRSSTGLSAISSTNNDGSFYLGTAFLSQIYLMVDQSAQRFMISRADSSGSNSGDITPWCTGVIPKSASEGSSPDGTSNRPSMVTTIIGSVLGGIAFLVALVAGILYVRSYRKSQRLRKRTSLQFRGIGNVDEDMSDDEDADGEKYSASVHSFHYQFDSPTRDTNTSPTIDDVRAGAQYTDNVRTPDNTLPVEPGPRSRLLAMAMAFQQPATLFRQKQMREYRRRVDSEERKKIGHDEMRRISMEVQSLVDASAASARDNLPVVTRPHSASDIPDIVTTEDSTGKLPSRKQVSFRIADAENTPTTDTENF